MFTRMHEAYAKSLNTIKQSNSHIKPVLCSRNYFTSFTAYAENLYHEMFYVYMD